MRFRSHTAPLSQQPAIACGQPLPTVGPDYEIDAIYAIFVANLKAINERSFTTPYGRFF